MQQQECKVPETVVHYDLLGEKGNAVEKRCEEVAPLEQEVQAQKRKSQSHTVVLDKGVVGREKARVEETHYKYGHVDSEGGRGLCVGGGGTVVLFRFVVEDACDSAHKIEHSPKVKNVAENDSDSNEQEKQARAFEERAKLHVCRRDEGNELAPEALHEEKERRVV